MESPFFRSYWDLPTTRPRYPPTARPIPVQPQPDRVFDSDRPQKVVSIPVRFVGSDRIRPDSAVRIQKVFRGFLVRKSLKKISAIRNEVIAIEERISKEEAIDLIGVDSKERLKVNETLMSLLLRLDSIRAPDDGVRDYRRSVIKKAIALQEYLDVVAGAKGAEETEHPPEKTEDAGVESESGSTESPVGGEEVVVVKEELNERGRERNEELLKRMVEENGKMMGMMAELVERNEKQTRVLSSLTQRVEQLERAFLCDKLRRMKKRTACVESPDNRRSGKR